MIEKKAINELFLKHNDIEITPFIDRVVRLTCYPFSNPDSTETFIGCIRYDQNFPMLTVSFPWREGDKTSFARESAVSPDIPEPKAYYVLKEIEAMPDEMIEQWFKAGKKFIEVLEKEKKKK